MATLGATLSSANFLGFLSATTTWDPASLADGASELHDITVTGANVGDPVIAGLTTVATAGWSLSAVVRATNTVSVRLVNNTGGTLNLGSGTLTAVVLKP